jgi:hypothetical protein
VKITNFNIEKGHAISCGSYWIDLHNDYLLEEMRYDVLARVFRAAWRCSSPSQLNGGAAVSLVFAEVSLLMIQHHNAAAQNPDAAGTLSFIGFLHPDSKDVMDGYLDTSESNESYHFIMGFEGGLAVKCYCESITYGDGS